MDRLINIIKDKHLLTWKDGELTGEGVGEYKLFFEHNGDVVVMSELDDMNFESIEYYMKAYDKGEGFRPYQRICVGWDELEKFLNDMRELTGNDSIETFCEVVKDLADSGISVHSDVRGHLEELQESLTTLLKRK